MGRASRIEFCCFGVPLINVGAYTICLQFIFVSACVILLALIPPQIVATAAALPSGFPKIIVAVLGVIALLWQFVGIVSIKRESTALYRTYIRINFLIVLITIIATLAFFAVAAARHSTALTACTAAYGAQPAGSSAASSSALSDLGSKICNIFIWVQVGFMGLLIALIGLTQLYMCAVQRSYGKEMRRASEDRKMYEGGGGMGMGARGGDEIPLATRGSGVWDAPINSPGYRSDMNASVDDGYYGAKPSSGANDQSVRFGNNHNAAQYESYSPGGSDGFGYRRSMYDSAAYGGGGGQEQHGHNRGESKQSAYYYAS